jgi:hypothetical protein
MEQQRLRSQRSNRGGRAADEELEIDIDYDDMAQDQ